MSVPTSAPVWFRMPHHLEYLRSRVALRICCNSRQYHTPFAHQQLSSCTRHKPRTRARHNTAARKGQPHTVPTQDDTTATFNRRTLVLVKPLMAEKSTVAGTKYH